VKQNVFSGTLPPLVGGFHSFKGKGLVDHAAANQKQGNKTANHDGRLINRQPKSRGIAQY